MAKIQELQKKYSLSKDDFWNLTGNVWIITHDAVERIAKMENVIFENPTIINSDRDYCHLFGTASIIKEGKYLPSLWIENAHKYYIRDEFIKYYQYQLYIILKED